MRRIIDYIMHEVPDEVFIFFGGYMFGIIVACMALLH